MGFEVLLSEALSLPEGALQRLELLELAKGKVRLEKLSEIANRKVQALLDQGHQYVESDEQGMLITRRDAQGNPLIGIDPVEIHLAYSVELASRLDLPFPPSISPRCRPAFSVSPAGRSVRRSSGQNG